MKNICLRNAIWHRQYREICYYKDTKIIYFKVNKYQEVKKWQRDPILFLF